jgi:uncharacterized protein YkwD
MISFIRQVLNTKAGGHRFLPLAAASALFAVFLLTAVGCTPQQAMEMNLALGINQMRADNGLPPVMVDASLSQVARYRAEDMATKGYFSHQPPGVSMAWAGEVIAWNNYPMDQTVQTTIRMWRDSPGHFGVITNPCFTRMGTGAAVAGDGRIYHVAVFEGLAPGC